MLDWEPRAVPNYSLLRKLPQAEARIRIQEWLHSNEPLQVAAGCHLVWDRLGGIFPDLLPEVAAVYSVWHRERAARDPRWLVRGSCVSILGSMKWPHPEIFEDAFAEAYLEAPAPADAKFIRYYAAPGQLPADDPTATVRENALRALQALPTPNLVSLAQSVISAPAPADGSEESLRVLAATILAEADPAGAFANLLEQASAPLANEQVEQFSKSAVAALRAGGDRVRDSFQELLHKCAGECLRVLAYDLASARLSQSIPLLQTALAAKTDLSERANLILDLVNFTDTETRLALAALLSTSCDGEANFIIEGLVKWENEEINTRVLEVSKVCSERLYRYTVEEIQRMKDRRDNWD